MTIEIPYVFLQAVLFTAITYPTINFYWSSYKVFWYLYTMFCTLLFFSYFGMLLASVTPTYQVASVLATFSYTMFNLFSGYLIPGPVRIFISYSSKFSCLAFLTSTIHQVYELQHDKLYSHSSWNLMRFHKPRSTFDKLLSFWCQIIWNYDVD